MISTFDNCLFIHIPKVAGQSMELAFLQRANLSWQQRDLFLLRANQNRQKGPPRLAHLTASEYLQLGYLTEKEFNSMFRFSFVRNPWDRLVSEYLYRNYPFSFNDFLYKKFPSPANDDYIKGMDGFRHVMPQYQFIYDKSLKLLVDFVGRYETLQKDFEDVTTRITGEPVELPYKNKTNGRSIGWLSRAKKLLKLETEQTHKRHYTEYYDAASIQWVHDHYSKDIELFNYTFHK